jgi:hypothetical protein
MSQEHGGSNAQPVPEQPVVGPAPNGGELALAPESSAVFGDASGLISRIAKMTNKMVQDVAVVGQTAAAMSQAMTDGFGKLQLTFAMLTKQVATNDVKIDANLLEMRKQFSADIAGLSENLGAQLM